MIYGFSLEPRILCFNRVIKKGTPIYEIKLVKNKPPTLLSVSRDSRAYALKKYTLYTVPNRKASSCLLQLIDNGVHPRILAPSFLNPCPENPPKQYYSNADIDIYHFNSPNRLNGHVLEHVKHILVTSDSMKSYLECLCDMRRRKQPGDPFRRVCPRIESVNVLMSLQMKPRERFVDIDAITPFDPKRCFAWHHRNEMSQQEHGTRESIQEAWNLAWKECGEKSEDIRLEFVSPNEEWVNQHRFYEVIVTAYRDRALTIPVGLYEDY